VILKTTSANYSVGQGTLALASKASGRLAWALQSNELLVHLSREARKSRLTVRRLP
jgi:hypothetical protein